MNTKEKLETALKDAMRSGDELRKRTIRMALSSIRFMEIEKGQTADEAQIQAVLQKEVKSRQESIADAQRANRPDLVAASLDEIAVLELFMPQQLSPDELEEIARQAIADTGATALKEMGQVMKALMPRLQGKASGEQASQAVKRLLGG